MIKLKFALGADLTRTEVIWERNLERVGQERDKNAFGELFGHFSPLLKAFLMKGGATAEQAEELVQETMIKVWRKSPTYDSSRAAANTWIYTIARNTRIDWLRSQNRRDPEALSAEELYGERTEPTPYSSLVHIRKRKQLGEQLKLLPAEQMIVLQHMYFQGKSGQQVAEELGVPLGTVKSRIRLALNKMKLALVEAGVDGEEAVGGK